MRVILVRHGKAQKESGTGRDRDRRLQDRGKRQSAFLGEALRAHEPGRILASPYVRAWETAEWIGEGLGLTAEEDPRLIVGCTASELIEVIQGVQVESLCLVGHNPTMEDAVGVLVGGPSGPPVRVRTGEAYCLTVDQRDPVGGAELVERVRLEE